MKIPTLLLLAAATLFAGCASTDMRSTAAASQPQSGAVIKSRIVKKEHYRDSLMFTAIDSRPVDPGFFRAPAYMEVKVESGPRTLNFRVVRSTGLWGTPMEAMGVLRIEAKSGRTYVLNSGESEGLVTIWVEDEESKEKVSEVVKESLAPIHVSTAIPIFIPVK